MSAQSPTKGEVQDASTIDAAESRSRLLIAVRA
jgi:hypothetical protein